jgi:hypothetical protein
VSRFADFVKGKTVALVGPAVAPYDQSAEVDSHEIVFRIGYKWDLGKDVPNYGTRTDAVFYNAENSRKLALGLYDQFIKEIPYILVKRDPKIGANQRYEILELPFKQANQVPIALHALVKSNPKAITVFGADIYLGGPATAYDKNYLDRSPERDWWGVEIHNPGANQKFLAELYRNHKKIIKGDDRFIAACKLSNRDYMTQLKGAWLGK